MSAYCKNMIATKSGNYAFSQEFADLAQLSEAARQIGEQLLSELMSLYGDEHPYSDIAQQERKQAA